MAEVPDMTGVSNAVDLSNTVDVLDAAKVSSAMNTSNTMDVRLYTEADLAAMRSIWNEVVEAARAFPQDEPLSSDDAREFFAAQSASTVAVRDGEVLGLAIVHPNNVGRCGHVANASFAVAPGLRGGGIGRALVSDALMRAGELGFRGMQFNAVVESNAGAIHLYEDLGFTHIGTIPGGFRNGEGVYEDTRIYYHAC